MKKIAVFASGGGTDFQSIIDGNEKENFCQIEYLIASKPTIGAIERANRHGIKTIAYEGGMYATKEEFYLFVADILEKAEVEYIVLAGWLWVVSPVFIERFENRIINIHPSLIPAFCGMGCYGIHVHEKAIAYGVKLSGATVHFVETDVDGGAILMQKSVAVDADDTPQSLQTKILKVEHTMLPECVKLLCEGRVQKEGRKIRILEK